MPPLADKDFWAEEEEYARLIGRVVISWNEVQWAIYCLFLEFCEMDSQRATDVFFSIKNDTSQRAMALAASKALSKHPRQWEDFRNTIGDLDRLAGERNAAVHTMWGFNLYSALLDPEGVLSFGPMVGTIPHRALKENFPAQCEELGMRLHSHFKTLGGILQFLHAQKLSKTDG